LLRELEKSEDLSQKAAKLTEILDGVVSDYCDSNMVSGEIAWQLIQALSDLRLDSLRGKSDSE